MKLKRQFSPFTILLISINGMIGSAWLLGPLYAAQSAGPAALVSWLIGSFAILLVAFTFAELSTMFPVAGGVSRIPQFSHGPLASFIISWIAWLSCVTMAPIEVQAMLQYASVYFPHLTHLVEGQYVLAPQGFVWAIFLMLVMCWINIISTRHLIRFNFLLTVFKIGIIFLIITAFASTRFHLGNLYHEPGGFFATGLHGIFAAVAVSGIAFAFTGFRHGVELAAETTNPKRAIPLAVIGSIVCCLIIYWLLQIVFFTALTPSMLQHGWQHLSFEGDIGPFVGIAALLGLGWLTSLIYANAIVSPLGAGLIYTTSTARIIYGMSKNEYFPAFFLKLNKNSIPKRAIWFNFAAGVLAFFPLPGWQALISFLVSSVVISYSMGPVSLIALRWQMPNAQRPFKLPAGVALSALAFYICNLIAYWSGWNTISKLMIAISIGLLCFAIYHLRYNRSKPIAWRSAVWLAPYLGGLTLISYLGSFGGGKRIIPLGWDFLVIAIFSFITLYFAVKGRLQEPSPSAHIANTLDSVDSAAV